MKRIICEFDKELGKIKAQHGIVNIIAVREADLENELYQHIAKSFQCAEVKEVFDTLYAGTFVPAWTEEAAE